MVLTFIPSRDIETLSEELLTSRGCKVLLTRVKSRHRETMCSWPWKVFGSFVAVALGLAFAGLQLLSYFGFVDIKWKVVEDSLAQALDVDGDGYGCLTA